MVMVAPSRGTIPTSSYSQSILSTPLDTLGPKNSNNNNTYTRVSRKYIHTPELIPVSYNYVSNRVPELWKKYNPIVVIHVGVSQSSKCIEIEQKAHSTGYDKHDTYKELPNESDILERAFQTDIDVKTICSNIKKCINNIGCQISMSDNAGRYLCEYIYYQSLNIDKSRVIFIHVPDISHYPSAQTAKALYIILCTLLKHLND
ncbi:pyroglutamyl-peptidase 1 [Orussus abietinus]|uniref:pyroglutamyl-peptidase 1 n=1 Tax=Orussus abietinus TaxID=222816 RepID=UPI0006269878|nr:pyroglutamyl-peptidase 1 [Orussus abietinus]